MPQQRECLRAERRARHGSDCCPRLKSTVRVGVVSFCLAFSGPWHDVQWDHRISCERYIYFRFEFGYLYSCQQRSSIYIARAIDAGDVVVGTLALVTSGARQVVQAE